MGMEGTEIKALSKERRMTIVLLLELRILDLAASYLAHRFLRQLLSVRPDFNGGSLDILSGRLV